MQALHAVCQGSKRYGASHCCWASFGFIHLPPQKGVSLCDFCKIVCFCSTQCMSVLTLLGSNGVVNASPVLCLQGLQAPLYQQLPIGTTRVHTFGSRAKATCLLLVSLKVAILLNPVRTRAVRAGIQCRFKCKPCGLFARFSGVGQKKLPLGSSWVQTISLHQRHCMSVLVAVFGDFLEAGADRRGTFLERLML